MPTEATPVAKLHTTSIHVPDLPYGQISSSPADNSAGADHLSRSSNTVAEVPVVLVNSDIYDSVVVKDSDHVRHHYPYTKDLRELDACRPQSQAAQIPPEACTIATPLSPRRWEQALANHPDRQFARYIVNGLRDGFRIGFQHDKAHCRPATTNMQSAFRYPEPVVTYLESEQLADRIVGPFNSSLNIQVNRFGVIPKSNQSGKWRLILDLSYPPEHSVNDGIDPQWCSLRYATVDQAIGHILQLGGGALLAKVDVEHAYRNIPVHPEDRHLLGMAWRGRLYIDTALPFGLRSAPKIFTAVADALEWVLLRDGLSWSIHYIDDFLTAGRAGTDECANNLRTIKSTCEWLGVPLKWSKVEGPTTELTFLGIVLDTIKGEIRLPQEKLGQLVYLVSAWSHRKACRKRELLSLIGKLAHACKVVKHGRTFLRRMIDTAQRARQLDHWIHLTAEFRSDLLWWDTFLPLWNGRSMLEVHNPRGQPEITFSSDASGSWGCGAMWNERWIQMEWNGSWDQQCIAAKELLPIALACAIWGAQWQHRQVLVWCDNMAVVSIMASQTSKDPLIMHLLRCMHFFWALHDISVQAEHIPGASNTVADAISRNNLQVMFQEVPSASKVPDPIHPALRQLLVDQRPDWLSDNWRALLKASLPTAWQQARGRPMDPVRQAITSFAES